MDTEIGCFMKPEVAMQRRKFGREFKLEAVKLVRARGVSVAQAARDLDVHENVLRKWVREFGADPMQASGELSGAGQLAIAANGTINGNATLNASAGSIVYSSNPGRPLLAWSSIGVDLDASGTTQHVRLHGALDDGGHVDGDVTVSGADHALQGTIDANLHSLAFLEALVLHLEDVGAGDEALLAAPRKDHHVDARATRIGALAPRRVVLDPDEQAAQLAERQVDDELTRGADLGQL